MICYDVNAHNLKAKRMRRGFTLVELLIVIVVIGILSAMMMISSTEAVTSAKVNNVIANMRQLKTAALGWYMDHLEYIDPEDCTVTYPVLYHNTRKYGGSDNRNISRGSVYELARQDPTEITRYLNNGSSIEINSYSKWGDQTPKGSYAILDGGVIWPNTNDPKQAKWFVGYCVPDDKRIKEKLAGRAKSLGLIRGWNTTTNTGDIYDGKNNNGKFVYMEILDMKP
ncbi:MAG: type II secretion system protein [Synergistaceae bacterium]|nr:type II secretion system protein [Synergistaceae bacterium]MBQ3449817.1 type II secretion system protein [Synergistaceae bacterium]MBQ3694731.1 type II secretion system protein [Synergistaceae bacterium]MBQ9629011.1 type II secretion system protein [Synergistaceae bacterium]MBR0249975.1 type II secretion system protein [Synergistaceae bacterium]